MILAVSGLAGCGYGPGYGNSDQPMMSTGAPCGYRAVDAGLCPKVGYKVPAGAHY
jgi:hypothetical protein